MQYQDPLEPTSNTEYVAQLATFSQLEGDAINARYNDNKHG
ncbi:flagellar hook capping FlgD N-terminal domain-containing protein [Lachnobacterium bovis]|nr:flagellar hook capping FlgD N-terminal domain-containing protein [Lachnobacterium bovis]